VVAYDYGRIWQLRGKDREYLLFRWDPAYAKRSLDLLRSKWNLTEDSTARRYYWVREHCGKVRSTYIAPRVINRIRRTVGLPNMVWVRGGKKLPALKTTD
jgi:hypothetical protein